MNERTTQNFFYNYLYIFKLRWRCFEIPKGTFTFFDTVYFYIYTNFIRIKLITNL